MVRLKKKFIVFSNGFYLSKSTSQHVLTQTVIPYCPLAIFTIIIQIIFYLFGEVHKEKDDKNGNFTHNFIKFSTSNLNATVIEIGSFL